MHARAADLEDVTRFSYVPETTSGNSSTTSLDDARALYAKMTEAWDSGDYVGAAKELRRARDLRASPKILYNVARVMDQVGQAHLAYAYYEAHRDRPAPICRRLAATTWSTSSRASKRRRAS